MNQRNGPSQPGEVILVPFILIQEAVLLNRRIDKEKAAEAHEAELLSQVRRFEELRALAVKGDAAIQCELAFCYLRGRGAIRDVGQATYWLQQSARQGFVEAQNELGLCYFNEIGVRWDKVEACAWWTLAAPSHERAKQSMAFAESEAGKRMTPEAFADFKESVHRRAAELRALIGRGAIAREPLSTAAQPEVAKIR
jgi:thermostable 8-oxoguanine DNA glycosylase